MKKEILGGIAGILLVFAGVASFYFYLDGLKNANNFLLLALSIVTFLPGIYVLYRAGQINAYRPNLSPLESKFNDNMKGQLIENNSKLAADWKKTTDQADKLKLISINTESGEGNS